MALTALIRRLFSRRASRTVDLEPVHQRTLRALVYFKELQFNALQAEVSAERETPPGETLLALLKLEHEGLIVRRQAPQSNRREAFYAPTRAGRRVSRFLPRSSTSTVAFRL
jgi:DNA-binding MarR family transcriptional regulator